jgi:hypothetical protein
MPSKLSRLNMKTPNRTPCPHGLVIFTEIPTTQGLATISLLDAAEIETDIVWWTFYKADGSMLGQVKAKTVAGFIILPPKTEEKK